MARQGRFGRSTSGSQNLSSLVYALLKDERTDQENTMLRAYTNNMQGGTARNTFSSGGATTSATAASVYAWYLAQASLAQSQGDNAGYSSLSQRAEEFRLQSLRDQENVINSSYLNGTSIDKSLFGLTGSGTISVSEYESILGAISRQPGMTEADITRIQRSIFGASYESASAQVVRDYNEKKIGAGKLVEFYNKELKRAQEAGIPADSARYQGILDARSRAVSAEKADSARSRYEKVANEIRDEKKAFAIALQKFISPVLESMFVSKSTVKSLRAKISDDGGSFMAALSDTLTSSSAGKFGEILSAAGTLAGMDTSAMEQLMERAQDFSNEATALTAAGYGEEAKDMVRLSNFFNESVVSGAFSTVTKSASSRLATSIAASGGVLSSPLTSDPYSTSKAFGEYIQDMGGIANSDRFDDILLADQLVAIGNGDLSILLPGANDPSVAGVVDQIVIESGIEYQDAMLALVDLLGNPNAWNAPDLNMVKVKEALRRMSINEAALVQDASSGGELTVGSVARLAVERDMLKRVDEDPNLVWGYQRTPRGYVYTPISVNQAKNGSYAITNSTGANNQVVFVEKVDMNISDNGTSSGNSGMFYVAVPGGGDLSTGQMDGNDYIEVVSGSQTIRLTRQDLDDYSTYASGEGSDFTTPMVDPQSGALVIGSGFVAQLKDSSPRSTFRMWLEITASDRGDAWYDSKFANEGAATQGKATDLVAGYTAAIEQRIDPNLPWQDRSAIVDKAVTDYITENGIVDKTGRIKGAIINSLTPTEPTVYQTSYSTSYGSQPSPYPAGPTPSAPSQPPAPEYVSPYLLQQTGGSYTVESAGPRNRDPESFFFRNRPGGVDGPGIGMPPVIPTIRMPEESPIPGQSISPSIPRIAPKTPRIPPITPIPRGGGRFDIRPREV
jgi:hypothetical protein